MIRLTIHILQEWRLTSENGGNIQLTFVSFNVEFDSSCSYDYVEVLYGDYSERFCGGENGDYLPGPFTSCGSSMVVKFHSDGSRTGAGFRAVWEELSTSTPCSATTTTTSIITSPLTTTVITPTSPLTAITPTGRG